MGTINSMMDGTLIRLDDPRAQRPGNAQLLQEVCSQIRNLFRQKRNSGNVWQFGTTSVDVSPGENTYQIGVNDFGTPLSVITVNDTGDSNFVVRRIPFYTPQDLAFNWGLPANAGYWLTGNWNDPWHTALRCAIFWTNNLPYIQFEPTPQYGCSYSIKYLQNANNVGVTALTASPLPDEDCDVVELRAALGLLAMAEWEGNDPQSNSNKRKEMMVTLSRNEQLAAEQFNIANLITNAPGVKTRDQAMLSW
jgi:hypothetical protein